MKRGVSIVLVLFMLTAMFHITVAMHFCGGEVAASKISISGKLASCGMEGPEMGLPLSGTYFTRHCCEDVVTFYGIDNNYTPSYSFVPESFQYNFQVLAIPVWLSANPDADIFSLYSSVRPPGALMSTNVDLSGICVFRI